MISTKNPLVNYPSKHWGSFSELDLGLDFPPKQEYREGFSFPNQTTDGDASTQQRERDFLPQREREILYPSINLGRRIRPPENKS